PRSARSTCCPYTTLFRSALTAPPTVLEDIADRLVRADNPVLVADNTGKDKRAYDALVRLAELLAAPVVDLQARHNFPTGHWADRSEEHTSELQSRENLVC